MADNVAITAGSGTTVAADEVVDATLGTVKVQYVKLMDGTLDGSSKAAVSSSGLKVDLGADNDVTVTSGTVAATQSGSWTVTAESSANLDTSLLLKTSDFNTSFGTAGSADPLVRTIQGVASMTPVQVGDNSGSLTVDQPTGSNLHVVTDSGTITTVSTVTSVTAIANALPAGTNAIGKLAANSGVDIGDVDVTSISAGTNNIGQVSVAPQTANGLSVLNATSSDGGTALTNSAQVIKASAGQVYGWFIYNPNATAQFVQFYNTAAASVTVGTTNPLFMLTIPATAGANVEFTNGITFSNAGFSCAATSTAGGNGAPSTALDAVIFYK